MNKGKMEELAKISYMNCLELECVPLTSLALFNGLEALRDDIKYFDSNKAREMQEKRRLEEERIKRKGLEILRRYKSEKGIKLSVSDKCLLVKYVFPLELPFRSAWRAKDLVVNLLKNNKRALDVALYILRSENNIPLKRGVIIALGQARREEGLELLVNCLDNEETYYESVMALGYIGGSIARNTLVNFMYTQDSHGLRHVLEYLGKINDNETVQSLLRFLEENKQAEERPSPIDYKKQEEENRKASFRKEIVQTLGKMKSMCAESGLIPLLTDRDDGVVGEAANSLTRIESRSSVNNLLACLEKENCPIQVAYALGELGDNSILDNLANALMRNYKIIEFETNIWHRDSHEYKRRHALELSRELITAMKKIDEDKSYGLLLGYLNHEKYSGYAAWALREFGSRSVRPLISCLGSIHPQTIRYGIEFLGVLKAREALPHLKELMHSQMVYEGDNDSKRSISELARETIEEILIGKSIRQILQEGDCDYFDKFKAGHNK
ncbi:MAG: hypothetical protein Q8N99_08160 [Nanoarchaeota archaeon]|nr:hypothetical protein [Nanoarchaeota archaeon]